MANSAGSLPLYDRIPKKNTIPRAVELVILSLLLSLLAYRLFTLKDHRGFYWLLALFCESFFAFNWILLVFIKWTQLYFKTYPDRLLQRTRELPPVDMFLTTADPALEPPIITVNTVLSLLAVDYPANKLACYVSDDGCSPLTFYSLLEASKFAKLWVPFCKKYSVPIRAPFRYFTGKLVPSKDVSTEFQGEWKNMKEEYERLCQKIEDAARRHLPCDDATGEYADFFNTEQKNHPTIIKVIWENKQSLPDGLPHLIYISREKRPKHPHHFKAGAMNVLTRVSGVMTNAPFMLNVDCDMYVHNPQVVYHAMCVLLSHDSNESQIEYAFAQFQQKFYDSLKDDPFGNQLTALYEYMGRGTASIQGPFYGGTGCFHRRKVIYGSSPNDKDINIWKIGSGDLQNKFGKSVEFIKSAAQILSGSATHTINGQANLLSSTEAAYQLAGCSYEYGSTWGKEVGWMYGSTTEDLLTGLSIHRRGWISGYCEPDPPAFLGCAPSNSLASLTQQKRWATGLLEILISPNTPLMATIKGKLHFRQCLAYLWVLLWTPRFITEISYSLLPAYCITTNSLFLPRVDEPTIIIPAALFVIYHLYTMWEYLRIGLSIREWWNNQKMWRLNSISAWSFGFLSVVLKLLGLSQTVFEVTAKDQTSADENDANAGRFTFNDSPLFVPGTTILLVNLAALLFAGFLLGSPVASAGIGEIVCSMWVVLCFLPFLRGLFGRGKYGIPSSIIFKSGALALLFVHFCKWTTMA